MQCESFNSCNVFYFLAAWDQEVMNTALTFVSHLKLTTCWTSCSNYNNDTASSHIARSAFIWLPGKQYVPCSVSFRSVFVLYQLLREISGSISAKYWLVLTLVLWEGSVFENILVKKILCCYLKHKKTIIKEQWEWIKLHLKAKKSWKWRESSVKNGVCDVDLQRWNRPPSQRLT